MGYKVLAINPGSTSTKVALYDEERPLLDLTLRHTTEELTRFTDIIDQLDWRRGLILSALREKSFDIKELSAVIGRGGLIRPIPAGVYEVNSRMRYDLRNAQMKHACNLGGLLAAQIAHMGGGISVGAHRQGKIVDVNNALDGDGPFAPDRAGSIPSSELIKVCFSGQYTREELLKYISSKGGMVAYLGTNSVMQVMERIEQGDQRAKKVLDALCYNVSKQIGAMAAALAGRVDGIILTGGIAYNEPVVNYIREHCAFIAPVTVYPGENELESLVANALVVLRGTIEPKVYK